MRKIKRRSVRLFFTSAFVTALVIIFASAMIFAEANTRKTGLAAVVVPFSANVTDGQAEVTVNDRDYAFSVKPILDILTSKAFNAVVGLWLLF